MTRNITTGSATVAARVAGLRELAANDAQAAQDATLGWFARLTRDFGKPGTTAEIEELFALGTPPRPVGPSRGHLIGWGDWAGIDPAGRVLFTAIKAVCERFDSSRFWLGKKYNPQGNSTNQFTALFANVARFVLPGLLTKVGDVYEGLEMITYVEGAYSSPGTDALILDFAPIESNPKLGRNIRDEVVEIVPGVHLARKTWNNGKGGYPLIAHWYETVEIVRGA
ncbi:hypothetical protein ACFVVM_25015 [Nocardia sp. NPDC058176]|uniref:hypothetical protein n=1 Tax=Nocardia sp. NPDC058176 TaxID=3346368 RepID=UPI0036D904A8